MSDTYIRDRNGHLTRAEDVTVPQNKDFRNAWEINGGVIEVDMHTARELYRSKVKAAETVQAAKLLPMFLDAELTDDPVAKAELVRLRGKAKDSVSSSNVDTAATPEALVALWDTESLGDWEDYT